MTAEEVLVARLKATPGVTALVGTRVYPMEAPQGAPTPWIVYQRVSTNPFGVLRGSSGLDDPRVQFNAWADTYSTAYAVAIQVRQSLDDYQAHGVHARFRDQRDVPSSDGIRRGVSQDYFVTEEV
jgi:hypothetical protein